MRAEKIRHGSDAPLEGVHLLRLHCCCCYLLLLLLLLLRLAAFAFRCPADCELL